MSETPSERKINIRKPYLQLIKEGVKTIEVRVGYPSMRKIEGGQRLRFNSGDDTCLTEVVKVAEYASFEVMCDTEDATRIGGSMDRKELLDACRDIYPPEKEALGVLAIHLRLLDERHA